MKEISASGPKPISASKPGSKDHRTDNSSSTAEAGKGQAIGDVTIGSGSVTPNAKVGNVLPVNKKNSGLGSNKSTRAANSSSTAETGKATSGSSKRKRKGWSSLKEIAENFERENARSISNLTIPFLL